MFDVEAFIRQAVGDIWNRKLPGRVYDICAPTVAVHGASGRELYGHEALIADLILRQAALPDCHLTVDDLIWRGDDRAGYLASLRYTVDGRNSGASIFGPATGRTVAVAGIAHWRVAGGTVREVWEEYDELGLIAQLGFELPAALAWLGRIQPQVEAAPPFQGEVRRTQGQLPPPELPSPHQASFDVEDFLRRAWHDIWNRRLVGRVHDFYAPDCCSHEPAGHEANGPDEVLQAVLARLAAFPDLAIHVDRLIWQGDDGEGYRASMGWTVLGTHSGQSSLGFPTDRRVRLRGLTHHLVRSGRIVEEWTQSGELGLIRQIHAAGLPSGLWAEEPDQHAT